MSLLNYLKNLNNKINDLNSIAYEMLDKNTMR
ncbi:hypothetical protein MTsN2n6_04740 [Vibrio fortis]